MLWIGSSPQALWLLAGDLSLSTPYGSSINDSIDLDTFTLSYCCIDDAFAIVSALGKGTLMTIIDLRNAFLAQMNARIASKPYSHCVKISMPLLRPQ